MNLENPKVTPQVPHATTGPRVSTLLSSLDAHPLQRAPFRTKCWRLYNWSLWTLLVTTLFGQFFGVIWSSVTTNSHFQWGRSPLLGKYMIPGFNDEPYSDRAVACVKRGQYYLPIQLSQLLKQQRNNSATTLVEYQTNGMDGYRVVSRDSFTMDATKFSFYERQCNTIMLTLENILNACEALGYNVTRDVLRIVDGVNSYDVSILTSTLPVLIIPYWDFGTLSRYVVPGHDGSACVFRGSGAFESQYATSATMSAVTRSVREKKTAEWIEYPGGVWRNGWYEDPVVNMKWYSDVLSSQPQDEYGIHGRTFDLSGDGQELDCSNPPYGCGGGSSSWSWDDQLQMHVTLSRYRFVAVSNGSRFGLFLFDALHSQTITSRYSLSKLISNASFAVLLSRWFAAMVALAPNDTIGIGVIANSGSFYLLPIFLLPRLKQTLEAFWSSGCEFEGDQRSLAAAWFEVYPAIGEVVLVYFSLLNTIAKLLRRRASDVMFGPTLLFFVALHYFRAEIAAADLLEFDKRISTVITADQLAAATLLDFFVTDLAFQVNGRVKSLYWMKMSVFVANLIPVVLFSRRAMDDEAKLPALHVETALARRYVGNAGLGSTRSPYIRSSSAAPMTLRPYELVRGDYVVISFRSEPKTNGGPRGALVSLSDWFWLLITVPVRRSTGLILRVTMYDLKRQSHGEYLVSAKPQLATIADSRLDGLDVWKPTAAPLS